MILRTSFFISLNGLFDFDFTFLSEAFLFLILSILVTRLFLFPISKQIEERDIYIKYTLKKTDIILSLACEKIDSSIAIVLKEIEELNRQAIFISNHIKIRFEEDLKIIEKENFSLINKAKANLILESADNFKALKSQINEAVDSFFEEKFFFE